MSFLDKVTKAVTDTVDRGKKEVDQIVRIMKVRADISQAERRIRKATTRIGEIEREIGRRAVELMRSGTLTEPELQAMAVPISEFERDIETQHATIAEKRIQIEQIKAEGHEAPTTAPPTNVTSSSVPPLPTDVPVANVPPPPPPSDVPQR